MRAFAITGMDTSAMIASIRSGSLMRATPPCDADVGGNALERHDGDGTGVFGDAGLLGR